MKKSHDFSYVFWLGGFTRAGKTTVSDMLSKKYGLKVYHCDEFLGNHLYNSSALKQPTKLQPTKPITW